MDNKDFLKLVELLEKESDEHIALEAARAAETASCHQTISDMQASFRRTIQDLNTTIVPLS